MLARNTYPTDDVEACRARIDEDRFARLATASFDDITRKFT